MAHEILVVSDTHLSPRTPEAGANWDAVVAFEAERSPALVVHLGDLTLDGSNDATQLALGREELDRLAGPWLAIPGNHDVGDTPGPTPQGGVIDEPRLERWLDAIGPDHFHAEVGGVHLIGVDALLVGSGLEAEAEQWSWLEATLGAIGADAPVVLCSHKPVAGPPEELRPGSPRYLAEAGRRRLEELMDRYTVPLVVSGHVHQHRRLELGGRSHAWAPTAWAVMSDAIQPTLGVKRCGVLVLTVDGGAVAGEVVEPTGLGQHKIGRDVAEVYA